MATKGPSPELSFKLICQEWIADGLTKWKMEKKFTFSLSLSLSLSSFLVFWYLGSKSGSLMSPFSKIILNMFFSFSELLSDSWILCLMRWGTGIKSEHSSSLGGGAGGGGQPTCLPLARLAEWRCALEEAILGQKHLGSVQGDSWPCHFTVYPQDKKVVMSGCFWTRGCGNK